MAAQGGRRTYPGWQIMIVVLVAGALVGGWIGEVLIQFLPGLANIGKSFGVGIPQFTLNLKVLVLTFGLTLRFNLFSIIGLVAGFLVYRRM